MRIVPCITERVAVRVMKQLILLAGLLACMACSSAGAGRADSSAGPLVYISNEMGGTVSVVDPVAQRVVSTIAVGKRPRGIRASRDGRTVFVALSGSPVAGPGVDESTLPPPERERDGIGVIDVPDRRLVRVLNAGTDPEQFAISADGARLFVANEDAGQVTVLDIARGSAVKTIPVGDEPEGVDLSADGRFVYVTSEAENKVSAIDAESLEVAAAIAVGPRPRSTAFMPDRPRAFVSAENDAAVYVIDTGAHTVAKKIALGDPQLRPMGVAASPDGRFVYVTTGRGGTLVKIDAATGGMLGSLQVGERPWGVSVSADGRTIVTANGPSNDVTIVDAGAWTVAGRVAVGDRPWGAVFVK
jgi:YVTN family beta-propeller protein